MSKLQIAQTKSLITTSIVPKQETYHLVTEENLTALKEKGWLSDLFIFLASTAWGTYIAFFITIVSTALEPQNKDLVLFRNISFGLSILFTVLCFKFYYASYKYIKNIKSIQE